MCPVNLLFSLHLRVIGWAHNNVGTLMTSHIVEDAVSLSPLLTLYLYTGKRQFRTMLWHVFSVSGIGNQT